MTDTNTTEGESENELPKVISITLTLDELTIMLLAMHALTLMPKFRPQKAVTMREGESSIQEEWLFRLPNPFHREMHRELVRAFVVPRDPQEAAIYNSFDPLDPERRHMSLAALHSTEKLIETLRRRLVQHVGQFNPEAGAALNLLQEVSDLLGDAFTKKE